MARKVFFSFHYKPDNWRAAQVRSMGVIEGDAPVSDNDWESITRGGDPAIKKWINGQLVGKSCVVVLIGSNTANRKWINYEIVEAWNRGLGVVGIHIHNLKDSQKMQSSKGMNPFDYLTFEATGKKLSNIVKTYDPPFWASTDVYAYVQKNLDAWVEEAIRIRENN